MSSTEVLREISRIARGGMHRVATWGPGGVILRDSTGLDEETSATVAEVSESKTKDGGSLRIKLHSKLDALDKLAKHYGLYESGADEPDDGDGPPDRFHILDPGDG